MQPQWRVTYGNVIAVFSIWRCRCEFLFKFNDFVCEVFTLASRSNFAMAIGFHPLGVESCVLVRMVGVEYSEDLGNGVLILFGDIGITVQFFCRETNSPGG